MIRRALSLFFITFLTVSSIAQTVPEITCVNVTGSNTIITWNQIDYLDFLDANPGCVVLSYIVKRANALDEAFVEITSIPYDQSSVAPLLFLDTDAQANLLERYYIVELETIGGCDNESNVVASMHLEYSTNSLNTGIGLNWNNDSLSPGSNVILQKRVDGGPWLDHFVSNFATNSFAELINNCHGMNPSIEISYRLVITDADCPVFSNIIIDDFVDLNPPDHVQIETISVDCISGETVIYWNPSVELDVGGYTIQYIDSDNLGVNAARTFDGTQDSLVIGPFDLLGNPNPDPEDGTVSFFVLPFDNCLHAGADPQIGGNPQPYDQFETEVATTMFVEAGYDVCTRSVKINWTPYISWTDGVERYVIEGSINNGPWELVEVAQGNVNELLIENVPEDVDYCFVVKAFANDGMSRASYSNKQCVTTSYPEVASDYGIENVTVVSDDQTEVTFSIDTNVEGAKYRLEKKGEFGDDYESLGTYPQTVIAGGSLTVTDFGVNNDNSGDEYRLIAIDSCLNEVGTTPISNSIHLEVFADDGDIDNVLTWNQYLKWDAGVQEYQVFFSTTRQMPSEPKFVLSPDETFKMDNVDEFLHSKSDFCYRIDAKENGSDVISQSNIKCTTQSPLFYLPNAMVLNGQNREWKPEGGFIDFTTYELAIYDRWGTLLFETKDFFEGWDGTYKGNQVREGVYAYFIKYREGGGNEQFRSGALTVLQAF